MRKLFATNLIFLLLLNVVGFSSRFNFALEENTAKLMYKYSNLIKEITGERILEEFQKILHKKGSTKTAFEVLEKTNIDLALFGRKFNKTKFDYFDNLDEVSFYYILGSLGGVSPWQFYKNRLKGEAYMSKALQVLDNNFSFINDNKNSEENIKWKLFLMLKSSPILKDCKILPENVKRIVKDMEARKIPMKLGDIPVTGNDIIIKFNAKDKEIGRYMEIMYKDALMNKYNWKSKSQTLKYLSKIK